MSRTIAELTAGTKIYLDETVDGTLSHVPYIYLGQDDSGNCIILREAVAIQKRMHSSNVAVYDGCEADLWLEDEESGYLSRFDAATRAALVSTQIKCNSISTGEIGVIARRCFLLSYTELGYATTPDEGASYLAALQTVTGKTGNNARIAYNSAAAAVDWWLRSAYSEAQFRYVGTGGNANSYGATNAGHWLRPALSVAPATIVSDGTEDTIYLLPDSAKTYREVDAVVCVGSSDKRPKRAKVMVNAANCTILQLQVSNNAKDENPIWVSVANGGMAELPNTTKTTDAWELGVKIYATSGGRAEIGEPVVIAEMEE
ncbi:MAG: DUF6273 domain-containing protein [Gemmiger sp.]